MRRRLPQFANLVLQGPDAGALTGVTGLVERDLLLVWRGFEGRAERGRSPKGRVFEGRSAGLPALPPLSCGAPRQDAAMR
jgi:hypothetical protein